MERAEADYIEEIFAWRGLVKYRRHGREAVGYGKKGSPGGEYKP
jgi:hypothetical protein